SLRRSRSCSGGQPPESCSDAPLQCTWPFPCTGRRVSLTEPNTEPARLPRPCQRRRRPPYHRRRHSRRDHVRHHHLRLHQSLRRCPCRFHHLCLTRVPEAPQHLSDHQSTPSPRVELSDHLTESVEKSKSDS